MRGHPKRTNRDKLRAASRRSSIRRTMPGSYDQGQRYEVRYKDGMGTERAFGFADDEKGVARLIERISHNPSWKWTRTIDRDLRKTAEVVKLEAAGG